MKSSTDVFLPMPDPSVKNSDQNCQFMVLKRHPRNSIFWSALNHLIRSELKVFKQSDLQQIGSIFLVHLHFPCAGTFSWQTGGGAETFRSHFEISFFCSWQRCPSCWRLFQQVPYCRLHEIHLDINI